MSACLKCHVEAHLSRNDYCADCFDKQDDLQTLIENARTALAEYRHAMTTGAPTAKLATTYGFAVNDLMEKAGWSISQINQHILDKVAA